MSVVCELVVVDFTSHFVVVLLYHEMFSAVSNALGIYWQREF